MAYDKNNLVDMCQPFFNGVWRLWCYRSADAIATVNTAGYISNGYDMGMKRDDVVIVIDTTNHLADLCVVASVTTNGSADLTDGLRITATNSD